MTIYKILTLIIGVLLTFGSLMLTAGTLSSWVKGNTESYLEDIIYFFLLVLPSAFAGVFLCVYSFDYHDEIIILFKNSFFG